jgi:hypothetical protein
MLNFKKAASFWSWFLTFVGYFYSLTFKSFCLCFMLFSSRPADSSLSLSLSLSLGSTVVLQAQQSQFLTEVSLSQANFTQMEQNRWQSLDADPSSPFGW